MSNDVPDLRSLAERVTALESTLNSFLSTEPDAPITLAANRFVLRDSNGIDRGLASAPDESSAALLLFDSRGTTRLFAGIAEQGPTVALYDELETPRVKFTVNESMDGSAVSLHDSKGTTQISMISIKDEPVRVALHDSNGVRRADLFYTEDEEFKGAALAVSDPRGKVRVMISDVGIAVLDSESRVIFYAPEISESCDSVPTPSQLLLYRNGQQHGPYPVEQVKAWIAAGQIQGTDQVWYEGADGWVTVASVPGLMD